MVSSETILLYENRGLRRRIEELERQLQRLEKNNPYKKDLEALRQLVRENWAYPNLNTAFRDELLRILADKDNAAIRTSDQLSFLFMER